MTTELTLLSQVAYRGEEITSARLRSLLALLAEDLRTGCSAARLIDGIWPDDQPENPTKALQILVSRARSQLGSDLIVTTPTGYRLALSEGQVDSSVVISRASASSQHSRAGEHPAALAQATAGLTLWDGAPDVDNTTQDPVSALRAARSATYRSLTRTRALALSRLGRAEEAIEPLAHLVQDRPHDEELLLELLRSEAATAGPSAALARYEAYRSALRDELGTDPGAPLQALYQKLLQGTAPPVHHGVEHEPNPLLGRDDDVAAVLNLLRASRVTSIVGPGGLGKTRLAHVVSRQAGQRMVFFVGLAGVSTDDDVITEVASTLGASESRQPPIGHRGISTDALRGIVDVLSTVDVLLVLDNCEHVVRGVADLVHEVVSMTKDLRVLTTSRAPLDLTSESVYLLPELGLQSTVELFEQRARAARPGVDLLADTVEKLCRRLDGLPLAVELAAARVRTMSVAEIADGVEDRFGLLRGGARDAPERHRTLHAVVEWSWNLLEPASRAAMRALSIFADGFTADAARHVVRDGDVDLVLEDLVDQSLLKVADTPLGTRFAMLETVREFSAAQLVAAGENDEVIDGFLAWARHFSRTHFEVVFGSDPYDSVAQIRAEQDNMVNALRFGLAQDDGATVAAATAALGALWQIESNHSRLAMLARDTAWLMSHFRPEPDDVEITRAALALCTTYVFLIEGPRATRHMVALRRLPPAEPDTAIRAIAIVLDVATRDAYMLAEMYDSEQPWIAGTANGIASYAAENESDPDRALQAAERMLAAFEKHKGGWFWALAHTRISELCLQAELGARARRHLMTALPVIERIGAWLDLVGVRWWLVLANLQMGEVDEAEEWLRKTTVSRAEGEIITLTYGLGVQAEILLARGDVDGGLSMWRQAVQRLMDADDVVLRDPTVVEPWTSEAVSVAVVAHAHEGRLDLVEELPGVLSEKLTEMLTNPIAKPFLVEQPICGALLLGLAMVELDRGERTGDAEAKALGARMVALAEQLRYLRGFQPTMSSVRSRGAATNADRSAYDEAMSSYADLERDELRAAALAVLRARTQN